MKLREIAVLKGQNQYGTEARFMSDSELVFILFDVCLFQLLIFHQRNAACIYVVRCGGETTALGVISPEFEAQIFHLKLCDTGQVTCPL